MRNIEEDSEGELVIGGSRLTNLRYADNTKLLASTQEKAKKIFTDTRKRTVQHANKCKENQNIGCYSE